MLRKNRRGWIRIVEAFTAILILAGIVLIVVGNQGIKKPDNSEQIRNSEISILREVQLNETLRTEILSVSGQVEWSNFSTYAPKTKSYIEEERPNSGWKRSPKDPYPTASCSLSSPY